jgi:hypothetical protein
MPAGPVRNVAAPGSAGGSGLPNAREPSCPDVGGHLTSLLDLDVEADVSRLVDYEPPPARGAIGVLKGRPDLPGFRHFKPLLTEFLGKLIVGRVASNETAWMLGMGAFSKPNAVTRG